jgi:GntR family transcriptional repressor for pyruvate dehydrogenase complex
LRQAASQVSQEQLLRVQRGVGGGYFTRQPEAKMVSRMAALYLKVHNAELAEIVSAFVPIRVELARLAARCKDKLLRDKLVTFLQREHEIDEDPHFRDFVIGERKFNSILGRMSGNKALSLFLEILLDLASMVDREEDMYRNHPDRVAIFRSERNKLATAIVSQDEEMATMIARRCAGLSLGWLMDDIKARTKPTTRRNGSSQRAAELIFEF